VEGIEKGGEAVFALRKGFIHRKLLAQRRFAFEPHVLGRILLRGIGSKPHTGDFPVGLGQVGILLREKLLEFLPSVIAGSIPQEKHFLVGVEALAPLKIRHGIDPVPGGGFMQMKILRQQIERPVIGLPLTLVGHGDNNRGVPLPPRPPTDISPHQVTFGFKQDNQLSPLNLFPARRQFFLISSRRSSTCASFRLGLPFSVR
jgi:hypothetical protein